jgi:DNA gyrase subunit A
MSDSTNLPGNPNSPSNVIPVNIEEEMRGAYLDYAMSVIVGRALPDVRDGLKPVHRRILFAMLQEGLLSSKKYSKCAGVVGEVLKHYHPHGDSPVYGALVRMAQPWNLRYPLIDGQGNFGSVDGDAPAAYRYTECRMTAFAEELLADIEKDTVDFTPNFDESVDEPVVLPSRIPNLLINGSEGIAVGMASSIPPHNLGEIVAATIQLIQNPESTVDDLMKIVPGPDFPTGATIYGSGTLRQIYSTGRGLIQLRAKLHIETYSTGKREGEAIIIDELPYQTNKAKLVEKIAELVNDKKIEGISRLRDESDRKGMRVVIELKKDAVTQVIVNQLYKLSPLQQTFGVIVLAIVDGKPQVLSLKDALQNFIEHRRTVVIRRTRFELRKATARLHILEGLRVALDNIEAVIKVIRASESTAIAKEALIANFKLSEIQAQHILDMPLRRLTGLERKAIEDEYNELLTLIEGLNKILASTKEVDLVVVNELKDIMERFGDARRTVIEENGDEIAVEDMIAEEDMMVLISQKGYAKRCSPSLYRAQKRGGKGVQGTKKLSGDDDDFISELFVASTHAYLLVFTTEGKLHWLKVYNLPEAGRTARGRAIINMIQLAEGEKVSAIVPVREFVEGKYILMATKQGLIKRTDLMEFSNVRKVGIRAVTLDEGDSLIGVKVTDGKSDCIISTKEGMAIRFAEEQVRSVGRSAKGVTAVNLSAADEVINLVAVPHSELPTAEEQPEIVENGDSTEDATLDAGQAAFSGEPALLTVCQNGYGKRTFISRYRIQNRAGKGLIDIKTAERNGPVVGMLEVVDSDQIMIITTSGKVIRTPVGSISLVGRNTMGVRLINLEEGEKVAAVAKIAEGSGEEEMPSEVEGEIIH